MTPDSKTSSRSNAVAETIPERPAWEGITENFSHWQDIMYHVFSRRYYEVRGNLL
jgi:hypothetical protein